jgi:hypothetical protein
MNYEILLAGKPSELQALVRNYLVDNAANSPALIGGVAVTRDGLCMQAVNKS